MQSETTTTNEHIEKSKIPLLRSLGLTTAILMVAGTIIGSGVFKKIAPMSVMLMNEHYILSAWIVAGIISMFGAFTMSGMATLTNEAGGIYEYLRLSCGNVFSFLYGWASFLVIGSAGNAAVAYVFAQSVNSVIPLPNPLDKWKGFSLGHFIYPFDNSGVKMLAIISILVLTYINILGTKKGGNLNNIITAAKITGILTLIIAGIIHPDIQRTQIDAGAAMSTNITSAFFAAMVSAFWAYDGWYCIGFMSGEIKRPERNVPLSIISGTGIVIVLYVLINYAFMHVLSLPALAALNENNIAAVEVARVLSGNIGVVFLAVLIAISSFGSLNALVITYPRLYYRMAQEKFFPKKLANVHPRYRTPYIALIYSGILTCVMVISGTFDILTDTVIIVEFLFFVLLGWALIKMKREGKITAKVIAYPLSPVILMLFSIGLVINTIVVEPIQSATGLIFTLSGIPLYYFYKKRRQINRTFT